MDLGRRIWPVSFIAAILHARFVPAAHERINGKDVSNSKMWLDYKCIYCTIAERKGSGRHEGKEHGNMAACLRHFAFQASALFLPQRTGLCP